ncbi:hypothetical protein LAZ67_13001877 [Cordylochernes scorpioides]|uniref:Reverse transcriptase Ty1/copia-type domain-containing protein n=1 Tax=Cordylochernes scorpioides TaxID=51811 RepID=A0ABY6L483_9ARAC|nr:hypothetical protein LAZ67_13001877 [Cordylochernes scorpioides]
MHLIPVQYYICTIFSNIDKVIEIFKQEFNAKDFGKVTNFLGMEISRENGKLMIKQTKFINKIFEKFNMTEFKKVDTPMELNFQAEQNQEDIKVPYRQLIGSLLYVATITRPDIMFPVSYLSRTLDKPPQATWKAAKRIVRYLMATKDIGLIYTVSSNNLISYSDSDWARDKIDRKSTSGNIVLYGSNVVSWFSKKQGCVSTAEAEYAASIQDLVHLKEINKDFASFEDTTLLVDNKSAICMAKTF